MDDEKRTHNSWRCKSCTMNNNQHMIYCEACLKPRNQITFHKKPNKDWECKLCLMNNNRYIPYCEACLVPRNSQQNKKVFKQLKNTLIYNQCNDYIKADQIRDLAQKIKIEIEQLNEYSKRGTIHNKITQKVQKEIENIFTKNRLECDKNIVQDFITAYNVDEFGFRKQKQLNKICHPICKCGTEMILKKSKKCYKESEYIHVICDICDQIIPQNGDVFHCPKQKLTNIHPNGFDICQSCREKYIHRLRYFVAIIICPTMTTGNHDSKDGQILFSMFKKLGFHKIVCLKGKEVTKQTVKSTLKRLSPQTDRNVNQLTVICYSGHGDFDYNKKYCFAINPKDKQSYISSDDIINIQCKASKCSERIKDGLCRLWEENWHGRYYRHNTLLLINSCHSGGSCNYIESKKIADSFSKKSALFLLLSMLGIDIAMVTAVVSNVGYVLGQTHLECARNFLIGGISVDCLCECLGISVKCFYAISIVAGISFISVVILAATIWRSINKSGECESIHAIASCHKEEESNALSISPFVKHSDEFFDIFLNPNRVQNDNETELDDARELAQKIGDSPSMLLNYLKKCYQIKNKDLGGMSLNDLQQRVCASKHGFQRYALCPILSQN